MQVESCRDCLNLEDRRDIDNVAECNMHHGPSVSCPEFKPKNGLTTNGAPKQRFCINCVSFEIIDGIPVCGRHHTPAVACGAFQSKLTS